MSTTHCAIVYLPTFVHMQILALGIRVTVYVPPCTCAHASCYIIVYIYNYIYIFICIFIYLYLYVYLFNYIYIYIILYFSWYYIILYIYIWKEIQARAAIGSTTTYDVKARPAYCRGLLQFSISLSNDVRQLERGGTRVSLQHARDLGWKFEMINSARRSSVRFLTYQIGLRRLLERTLRPSFASFLAARFLLCKKLCNLIT